MWRSAWLCKDDVSTRPFRVEKRSFVWLSSRLPSFKRSFDPTNLTIYPSAPGTPFDSPEALVASQWRWKVTAQPRPCHKKSTCKCKLNVLGSLKDALGSWPRSIVKKVCTDHGWKIKRKNPTHYNQSCSSHRGSSWTFSVIQNSNSSKVIWAPRQVQGLTLNKPPPQKKGKQKCSGFGWMIRE